MEHKTVPYIAFEAEMARHEREKVRLIIVIVLLIISLVGSWLFFWHYESQFEDIVITQENADGYNNYIGNDGDITNGKADD